MCFGLSRLDEESGFENPNSIRKGTVKLVSRSGLCFMLTFLAMLVASSLPAKDTLQIDKAYIGTTDSWRDVTIVFAGSDPERRPVDFHRPTF